MPKSRRSKLVSLTQTQKKGRDAKDTLIEDIRSALEEYSYVYLFNVDNMRNIHFKDIRTDWSTSRFFMGKNRVMSLALGLTPETEQHKGLSELAQRLTGQVGIFMTNEKPKKVTDYFARFVKTEYARGGFVPSETIVIPEGQVMAGVEPVVHTLEPMLRRLGLPSQLKNGKVMNLKPYEVAKAGVPLTPEHAHILKLLLMPIAEFRVTMLAYWHDGEVTHLVPMSDEEKMAATKRRRAANSSGANRMDDGEDDDEEDEDEEMDE